MFPSSKNRTYCILYFIQLMCNVLAYLKLDADFDCLDFGALHCYDNYQWPLIGVVINNPCRTLSVLGPLLFIVFSNDISNVFKPEVATKLYADDLKKYVSVRKNGRVQAFDDALENLNRWATESQLPLSLSKCSFMRISNR